jgi:hypothetical protein
VYVYPLFARRDKHFVTFFPFLLQIGRTYQKWAQLVTAYLQEHMATAIQPYPRLTLVPEALQLLTTYLSAHPSHAHRPHFRDGFSSFTAQAPHKTRTATPTGLPPVTDAADQRTGILMRLTQALALQETFEEELGVLSSTLYYLGMVHMVCVGLCVLQASVCNSLSVCWWL